MDTVEPGINSSREERSSPENRQSHGASALPAWAPKRNGLDERSEGATPPPAPPKITAKDILATCRNIAAIYQNFIGALHTTIPILEQKLSFDEQNRYLSAYQTLIEDSEDMQDWPTDDAITDSQLAAVITTLSTDLSRYLGRSAIQTAIAQATSQRSSFKTVSQNHQLSNQDLPPHPWQLIQNLKAYLDYLNQQVKQVQQLQTQQAPAEFFTQLQQTYALTQRIYSETATRRLFSDYPTIAESLVKKGTILRADRVPNSLQENRKVLREFITTIQHEPAKITAKLTQLGFVHPEIDPSLIRQELLFHHLGSELSKLIKQQGVQKIRASLDTSMKIQFRLSGAQDEIFYLVDCLNRSFKEQDFSKVKHYLTMLELNEVQHQQIIQQLDQQIALLQVDDQPQHVTPKPFLEPK